MASQNKKNKAKNSYIYNGNENAKVFKGKRWAYYIKANRLEAKKEIKQFDETKE